MKFKIGTKKLLRDDLIVGKIYGNCEFILGMNEFEGEKVTIVGIIEYLPKRFSYMINEDNKKWQWNFKMFR